MYGFLSDFRNFEKLMPEQVVNWIADKLSCSFTIRNMGDLNLRIAETENDARVHIKSAGKTPFDFDLIARMAPSGDDATEVHFEMNADMPPMILMMAKKPLQNLVNHMVHKVKEHHS